ncbi:hypothetical protein KDH_11380 [Dictyobacter sp. S3.2.2.5]|uniref:Uncharacterized protein n=1 Tax=Dictyobacter halimunensis TaxID=3026934 RepID=A0ABQ6FJB7_9CHLR|nr:hypothetical protein KDH_11380 [Dictyobacter sp. S3.2.2.5]
MAERMKAKVRMYPVGHIPGLTAPGVVVNITLEALRDVSQDAYELPYSDRQEKQL